MNAGHAGLHFSAKESIFSAGKHPSLVFDDFIAFLLFGINLRW